MPRKPSRIVESIKAAASILKLHPDVIKRAKEAGCEAFEPGNRIDIKALESWIAKNPEKVQSSGDADSLPLKEQKIREEVRKLKIGNDTKEGRLILKSDRDAEISQMASECQRVLYSIPPRAPELAGLTVAEIESKLRSWLDDAVKTLATE